jgi:Fur family peroxide stress response transcriptional regulator
MKRITTWCARSAKQISDIGEKELGLVSKSDKLPGGFLVERYAVDVIGICAKCQQA